MSTISPNSAKAAPIRQDPGRFPRSNPQMGATHIMAYTAAATTPNAARNRVCDLTDDMYRIALAILRDADKLRETAGLPVPAQMSTSAGVYDLDTYRSRRQAVS